MRTALIGLYRSVEILLDSGTATKHFTHMSTRFDGATMMQSSFAALTGHAFRLDPTACQHIDCRGQCMNIRLSRKHSWMIIDPSIHFSFLSSPTYPSPYISLNSMRLLQHLGQLALLPLQIRVPANMLLGDEDVGHGALVRHLLEGVLDRCSVV